MLFIVVALIFLLGTAQTGALIVAPLRCHRATLVSKRTCNSAATVLMSGLGNDGGKGKQDGDDDTLVFRRCDHGSSHSTVEILGAVCSGAL